MLYKIYDLDLERREFFDGPFYLSLPISVPPVVKLKFQLTVGDGGCFYYSIIDCIIDFNVHSEIQKLGDVSSRQGLSGNFRGMLVFRKLIHDFLRNNMHALLSKHYNFFVDENGEPSRFLGDTVEDDILDFNEEKTSLIRRVIDKCWRYGVFDHLSSGQMIDEYFWADGEIMVPLVCLIFGISLYYYTTRDGQRITQLFHYRGDGSVQHFNGRVGFHAPHRGATGLRYNGRNHFESLKLKEVDVFSESPEMIQSTPKKEKVLLHGGEVDLNTPSPNKFRAGNGDDAAIKPNNHLESSLAVAE
jgi:hypothetical protein